MRISTSEFYSQGVQSMDGEQSQLNQLYQQISSGVSLETPADNPLGAAQAVQLTMTSATFTQYSTNQSSALTALQLEDSTLSSVTTTMQSINSLMIEAGNATLADADRSAIAQQMQTDLNQLVTLANTTDATGKYLFSGFQATTQPFAPNAAGSITYVGDGGVREAQIAGTTQVATNDSGAHVFMSVPSIGTSPVPAGLAGNTGTGTIAPVAITNPTTPTNGDSYSIAFSGVSPAPLQYQVTDTTTGTSTALTNYTAGAAISLGAGMTVAISGTPNAGDAFTVTPATASANSNVFAAISSVISTLQTPTNGAAAAEATLSNALATGMTQLQNSLTNVTVVQASVGGREQQIQALQTVTQSSSVQVQNDISNVTSTNLTSAVSQLELTKTTLQAAQAAFAKIEGLSLFQYIN